MIIPDGLFFSSAIKLLREYRDELFYVLLIAIVLAVIDYFIVEEIMLAVINNRERVDRWKGLVFFTINMLLIFVSIPKEMITEAGADNDVFVLGMLMIVALSAVIYNAVPILVKTVKRLRLKLATTIDDEEL